MCNELRMLRIFHIIHLPREPPMRTRGADEDDSGSAWMRAADRVQEVTPPPMTERDADMARVAQRLIMEALDRSRAAAITLTTDKGKQSAIERPPAAWRPNGQRAEPMSDGGPTRLMPAKREL